jgi:hypothetical protein
MTELNGQVAIATGAGRGLRGDRERRRRFRRVRRPASQISRDSFTSACQSPGTSSGVSFRSAFGLPYPFV